jgi:hypothetical protein
MNLAHLQRALQAHIVDSDAEIASAIESSEAISSAIRLRIYSDAYRLRLIDALAANFPVLAQALGEESFARLAQEYLAVFPSRHYSIRWFGHRLAEFLSEYPDYQPITWLRELAAWEWKTAAAFDATDATAVTVDHLAAIASDAWPELRLTFHPSVQRISLSTNIVSLVKATASDAPLPSLEKLGTRSEWLIWREGLNVQYRSLDASEAAAIDAAMLGANFEALCESISEHIDIEQVPLQAAGLLKRWISDQCIVGATPA